MTTETQPEPVDVSFVVATRQFGPWEQGGGKRGEAEKRKAKSEVRAGFHPKDAKDAKSPRKAEMHSEILKLPCGLPSAPILYICGSVLAC